MDDTQPPLDTASAPPDSAAEKARLFTVLYQDLRRMAQRHLRRDGLQMVSPTTLLHESYLSLSASDARFADEARFLGYASRVMRGLLIDLLRERLALKRGGGFLITQLDTAVAAPAPQVDEIERLAEAIDELEAREPRLAELVNLRYFCGYTLEDIAAMRGCSARTLQRDWEKARMILFHQLTDGD